MASYAVAHGDQSFRVGNTEREGLKRARGAGRLASSGVGAAKLDGDFIDAGTLDHGDVGPILELQKGVRPSRHGPSWRARRPSAMPHTHADLFAAELKA